MKKLLSLVVVVAIALGLTGVAMARWGNPGVGGPCWQGTTEGQAQPGQGPGWGPGQGRGMRGRGSWGPGGGPGSRPGAPANAQAVDEAKATEIANEYVTKSLPGFTVQKVSPFQRPRGTTYQVELKGPKDEVRYIHINPWGAVRDLPGRTF